MLAVIFPLFVTMARLGHFNLLFQRHYYALRSQIRPYLHYTRRAANTVGEGNGYGALVTGTSSDMTQKGSHLGTSGFLLNDPSGAEQEFCHFLGAFPQLYRLH